MLTHLTIKNFRCLHDVSVPLKPLTVLIGPNDTGKSIFLRALRIYAGLDSFLWPLDHWRGDRNSTVRIESPGLPSFDSAASRASPAAESLVPITRFFQLPSNGPAMLSGGHPDTGPPPLIEINGQNVPALVDYLLRRDRKRFFAIRDAIKELIPGFGDLEIGTPKPAERQIEVEIENGFRLPADEQSVGVRVVIFFVALAFHPTPPRLILIEEPENGVHPKRLGDVMRLLREITEGKHGNHAAQVILTTHSPYLLDHVDLSKDQVLVFRRNDDGSRSAEPADAERLKTFLDEFMLGEVWYNVGEEGLVRKQ